MWNFDEKFVSNVYELFADLVYIFRRNFVQLDGNVMPQFQKLRILVCLNGKKLPSMDYMEKTAQGSNLATSGLNYTKRQGFVKNLELNCRK